MKELFFVIWFFLPAGIANVTPIFATRMPFLNHWNYPLDFYKCFNGKRILGDHKTIRGFISGIIIGTVSSYLLFKLSFYLPSTIYHLPSWYYSSNSILLGILLSAGALLGDAVKSFFKRRANVKPGSTWIPFDQIDYIVGGLFFVSFIHVLSLVEYILILIVWVAIHIVSTVSGYFLHLKDQPY